MQNFILKQFLNEQNNLFQQKSQSKRQRQNSIFYFKLPIDPSYQNIAQRYSLQQSGYLQSNQQNMLNPYKAVYHYPAQINHLRQQIPINSHSQQLIHQIPQYPNQYYQTYHNPNYQFQYKQHHYPSSQIPKSPQISNKLKTHKIVPKSTIQEEQNLRKNESNYKKNEYDEQISSQNESSYDQQMIYSKRQKQQRKTNLKYNDKEQIRKWIMARKRNYPRRNMQGKQQARIDQKEMSQLQIKIRKKLRLVSADPRHILKKLRNISLLKRLISNPKILTKAKSKNRKNIKYLKQFHAKKNNNEKIQNEENSSDNSVQQLAIQKVQQNQIQVQLEEKKIFKKQPIIQKNKNNQVTPNSIIAHLKEKQLQDWNWLQGLMKYRTNSDNYKYCCQTLQINLLIQDILHQSSQLLQVIRYICNHNYLQQ